MKFACKFPAFLGSPGGGLTPWALAANGRLVYEWDAVKRASNGLKVLLPGSASACVVSAHTHTDLAGTDGSGNLLALRINLTCLRSLTYIL